MYNYVLIIVTNNLVKQLMFMSNYANMQYERNVSSVDQYGCRGPSFGRSQIWHDLAECGTTTAAGQESLLLLTMFPSVSNTSSIPI